LSPFCHKNTHRKLHAEIKQAVDLPNSREIFPQGVGEQVTAIASFGREKFAETTNVDHPRATPEKYTFIGYSFLKLVKCNVTNSLNHSISL